MQFDIDGIEAAETLEALDAAIVSALRPAELQFFIYISTDPAKLYPALRSNLPELHAGASQVFDPFLEYCCDAYKPTFTGVDFIGDHLYLQDEDVAFIRRAQALYGWRTGVGVPVRLRGSDRYGGFNFGSTLPRAAFAEHVAPLVPDLRVFALLAHRRVEELSRSAPALQAPEFRQLLISQPVQESGLTPREAEVLYLMTQGYATKEIARLCSISPHTAAEYRKSLYRKLGVRNASAAVAKALELGLG